MAKFKATTTADEIINYKGLIDPSSDLEILSKKEILRYTNHLLSELKSKNEALLAINDSFDRSIATLKVQNIDSVITPIMDKLVSMEKPDSMDKPPMNPTFEAINRKLENIQNCLDPQGTDNNQNPADHSEEDRNKLPLLPKVDPFSDHRKHFLSQEDKTELSTFAETVSYERINDQRSVHYYGDYKYVYTGGTHKQEDMPAPIKKLVNAVKAIKNVPETTPCSCLVTKYESGADYCPPHSDDEWSIDPRSDIHTYSIGAARPILFSEISNSECNSTVVLDDNSLLTFSKTSQAFWKHAIPAVDTCADHRYSFTIRFNAPFYMNSTVVIGDSNTKNLKFGAGKGNFGIWVPGEVIKATKIENIPSPENIGPYRNVVIHTGINNLTSYNPKSHNYLINELERKCNAIHAAFPKTKIFLSPLFPTMDYRLNCNVSTFNERIVSLTKKHHNIILINNGIFLDYSTYLMKEQYHSKRFNDVVHLGDEGVRQFAKSIKSYVSCKNLHIKESLNYIQAFNYSKP